ncbi:MAG: NADH:ubiquinone reductase (Na(+)-transporting) subunit A, partial [Bacteroidales bacterium]
MENVIRLKKGLNIRMEGNADGSLHAPTIFYEDYAVMPNDYYGLRPKLMVGKGDRVLAGSPLFYDKGEERIKICSPVSGLVSEIVYGPKRCIERIQIKAEEEISYIDFPTCEFSDLTREKVKENLLNAGLWSLIRQRPYEVIPNPDLTPRDIFISCFDTAPLA